MSANFCVERRLERVWGCRRRGEEDNETAGVKILLFMFHFLRPCIDVFTSAVHFSTLQVFAFRRSRTRCRRPKIATPLLPCPRAKLLQPVRKRIKQLSHRRLLLRRLVVSLLKQAIFRSVSKGMLSVLPLARVRVRSQGGQGTWLDPDGSVCYCHNANYQVLLSLQILTGVFLQGSTANQGTSRAESARIRRGEHFFMSSSCDSYH